MSARYHKTKLPDGTTRDTHRLIMERSLGRRLSRWEFVHHINGNPRDNRLENLEVMSARDHGRHHHAGTKRGPLPLYVREKVRAGMLAFRAAQRALNAALEREARA